MRDETAEPSTGSPPTPGMPRSRPQLWQSGVRQCSKDSRGSLDTPAHHPLAAALCWAGFGLELVCQGLRLVFAAEEPCSRSQSGIPPPKGSARALFLTLPHRAPYRESSSTPPAAIRPLPPPGAQLLYCASSLNACQVLACPQSCGDLRRPVKLRDISLSLRADVSPGLGLAHKSPIMHPFFRRSSFFYRALVSRVAILCRRP